MKTGLLLEGGAMRGLYTAAIMDVMMENNIAVDEIIGVSAGALFGINYKSKQVGRVLRYNKKYAAEKEYMGIHSLITTGDFVNKEFCFDKLVHQLDPVDFDTYKNSPENFYAVVTNIETGQPEYVKIDDVADQNAMEYLRASGSMPFVSKPVCVRGKQLLDGGIADSIPIAKMMQMGCDKVIVVLTRPKNYRKEKSNTLFPKLYYRKYPNLVEAINNRYAVYNSQLDQVAKLENEGKIFVFRPSKLVNIKRTEKNPDKLQEMYDLGVRDANANLPSLMKYLMNKFAATS